MDIYVPDYYENFRCIGSFCRDNCCIGWEIDIDSEALSKYMTLDGELGDELRANITRSEDGSDCFKLAARYATSTPVSDSGSETGAKWA